MARTKQESDNANSRRSSLSPRASQDARYQRGARRTAGQPLAASWQPKPGRAEVSRKSGKKETKSRSFFQTYSWRLYAVPILVILTIIAFLSVDDPAVNVRDSAADLSTGASKEEPQIVGEAPFGNSTLDIPSAELPNAKTYKDRGTGEWRILPGATGPFGSESGKLYTYTVEIENGIDASAFGGADSFASVVDGTLRNEKSWIGGGAIRLQRIDSGNPDFRVSLTTSDTARRPDYCNYTIKYEASCWNRSKGRVVINLARWLYGAMAFESDLGLYRQYAINHEIGHVFGQKHKGCSENGALAPVMMQQSFGVANNYVWELNQVDETNKAAVAKDDKVCRPNPWPRP